MDAKAEKAKAAALILSARSKIREASAELSRARGVLDKVAVNESGLRALSVAHEEGVVFGHMRNADALATELHRTARGLK